MWLITRRPVGTSSVPAMMLVVWASGVVGRQKRFDPQVVQKPRSAAEIELSVRLGTRLRPLPEQAR